MVRTLLVPNPLLGPSTWRPVAEVLGAEAVSTAGVRSGPALVQAAARLAGKDPLMLVPHSNAGLAVPALGERVDLRATVYVDAALPIGPPGEATPLAPPRLLDFLRSRADADGLLPPWTHWWDDLTGLFPSAEARAAVEAEQTRLPLSYFTGRLPVPQDWAERSAYLAFGTRTPRSAPSPSPRAGRCARWPGGTCSSCTTPRASRLPCSHCSANSGR